MWYTQIIPSHLDVIYCFHCQHKNCFLELHLVGASVAQFDSAMYFLFLSPSFIFSHDSILSESAEIVLQRHSDDISSKEWLVLIGTPFIVRLRLEHLSYLDRDVCLLEGVGVSNTTLSLWTSELICSGRHPWLFPWREHRVSTSYCTFSVSATIGNSLSPICGIIIGVSRSQRLPVTVQFFVVCPSLLYAP